MQANPIENAPEKALRILYLMRLHGDRNVPFDEYVKTYHFIVVDDEVYATEDEEQRVKEYLGHDRTSLTRATLPDAIVIHDIVVKNRYGYNADGAVKKERVMEVIAQADKEYKLAIQEAELVKLKKRQSILDEWARQNARFDIGDIISYPPDGNYSGRIIRIETMRGGLGIGNKLYVVYKGTILNKKLKPNLGRDGGYFDMYDDGREIVKLK